MFRFWVISYTSRCTLLRLLRTLFLPSWRSPVRSFIFSQGHSPMGCTEPCFGNRRCRGSAAGSPFFTKNSWHVDHSQPCSRIRAGGYPHPHDYLVAEPATMLCRDFSLTLTTVALDHSSTLSPFTEDYGLFSVSNVLLLYYRTAVGSAPPRPTGLGPKNTRIFLSIYGVHPIF